MPRNDLQEKRLESGNENVFEELQKMAKDYRHGDSLKIGIRDIAKDYKAGALNLHLHFLRYGACVEINRDDNGSTVNRLGVRRDANTLGRVNGESDIGIVADGHEGRPMFIDVVQALNDGKGVTTTEFIRSEAWLKTLDYCQRRVGNSLRVLGVSAFPFGDRCNDWKLSVNAVMTCIPDANEPANQIIERGSHIVNTISDDRTNADRRVGVDHMINDPRRIIRRIGFEIGFVFYELDECFEFSLKDVEMFLGPGDLRVEAFHPGE